MGNAPVFLNRNHTRADPNNDLSASGGGQACVISLDHIYCIGGVTESNACTNALHSAPVSSGGVGTSTQAASYPVSTWTTCIISSDCHYCVGGADGNSAGENGATHYAFLDSLLDVFSIS